MARRFAPEVVSKPCTDLDSRNTAVEGDLARRLSAIGLAICISAFAARPGVALVHAWLRGAL
ncbi:hypothetical protein [Kaistia sp. MMO-174]|uniref:hypothetical protein n=1 Tax=Kaistia sp. MMO-174 TaxID=3081256 RepID=UPI0030167210